MRALLRFSLVIVLVLASAGPASSRRKKGHTPPPSVHKRSDAEIEAATQLQVFLDRANFSPGKIDGHYNDFTLKALALYRDSRGEPGPEVRSQRSEDGEAGSEGRKPEARDQMPEDGSQPPSSGSAR